MQGQIDQLLTTLNKADKAAINRYLKRNSEHDISFSDACSWPDAIKSQGDKQFNHWHFINVSRQQTSINAKNCSDGCVQSAIHFHANLFIERQTKIAQTKAMLFLSHWIADIHQPLHVSYQSDLGGNKIAIVNATKGCQNLHRIWDSCLLKKQDHKQNLAHLQAVKFIFSDTDILSPENVTIWANESLNITRQPSVQYCRLVNNSEFCRSTSQTITLSKNYFNLHSPILMARVHQAARRLNYYLLNNL